MSEQQRKEIKEVLSSYFGDDHDAYMTFQYKESLDSCVDEIMEILSSKQTNTEEGKET